MIELIFISKKGVFFDILAFKRLIKKKIRIMWGKSGIISTFVLTFYILIVQYK